MTNTSEFLNTIKQTVLAKEPTATIYLYGSRARGTARPDSDWDLLILVDKETISYKYEDELTDPLYDIEFETGNMISPHVYSKNEWFSRYSITPYFKNVMRDCKAL